MNNKKLQHRIVFIIIMVLAKQHINLASNLLVVSRTDVLQPRHVAIKAAAKQHHITSSIVRKTADGSLC